MTLNRPQRLLDIQFLQRIRLVYHLCNLFLLDWLNFPMLPVDLVLRALDHRCVLLCHHHVNGLRVHAFRDDGGALVAGSLSVRYIRRVPQLSVLLDQIWFVERPRWKYLVLEPIDLALYCLEAPSFLLRRVRRRVWLIVTLHSVVELLLFLLFRGNVADWLPLRIRVIRSLRMSLDANNTWQRRVVAQFCTRALRRRVLAWRYDADNARTNSSKLILAIRTHKYLKVLVVWRFQLQMPTCNRLELIFIIEDRAPRLLMDVFDTIATVRRTWPGTGTDRRLVGLIVPFAHYLLSSPAFDHLR